MKQFFISREIDNVTTVADPETEISKRGRSRKGDLPTKIEK
jgi:hypothetical protein